MDIALDAHAKPPASVRALYKHYQKVSLPENVLEKDSNLIQIGREGGECSAIRLSGDGDVQLPANLHDIHDTFLGRVCVDDEIQTKSTPRQPIYEVPTIPGKTATHIPTYTRSLFASLSRL